MLGQASGTSFPYQNKGKFHIGIKVFPQTNSSLGTTQQCVDIKSLRLLSAGHLNSWCIRLQLKMNRHFTNQFLIPFKSLAIALEPLRRCDSSRSDVSMRALLQLEYILRRSHELLLTKQ